MEELLAALSLEQKVRLLTGADFWSLHPEPAVGLRRIVMSDGPAGRARRALGRARAVGQRAVADGAGRDLGRGADRAARPAAGVRVPAQGRRRPAGADRQPPPLAVRRPPLRVLQRGPAADGADRRRLRARAAGRGRGRDGQALRRQRLGDRALHARRARRRADAAGALHGAVRADPGRGAVGGDGRLQRGQRAHDDRVAAAATRS